MLDGAPKRYGCEVELEEQRYTDIRMIVAPHDELVMRFDSLESEATNQLGTRWDLGPSISMNSAIV